MAQNDENESSTSEVSPAPEWYAHFLTSWRTYEAQVQAFNRVEKATGVKWGKKTHLRKVGIDRASAMGASREEIANLSKHSSDKIDTAYMPELPVEALHVGAGFRLRPPQAYNVPRTRVELPWDENEATQIVFPVISEWERQRRSSEGDPGEAARNFLHETL
ncbi:MAG: hypothetical protein AAGM67_21165, partial [Bacteroidota bacterium]